MAALLNPELAPRAETLIRVAYAALLLAWIGLLLPQVRRFFLSERWGGYAAATPAIDAVQNPVMMPLVMAAWIGSAVSILAGFHLVIAALVNLVICRYYFVAMRWASIGRGLGAPGFMTYWLAAALFLLAFTAHHAPGLRPLALLVLQIDFAAIMLSAGLYKFASGYSRNHGMELGMANPEWGYWWRRYLAMRPSHPLFRVLNHFAWTTEIAAAVLMLIPATRMLGGLIIMSSFAFVATQIRLAFLCEMLIVCGLLFVPPGSGVDTVLAGIVPAAAAPVAAAEYPIAATILRAALVVYLALLPLAYAGLFRNFYAKTRLPGVFQRALERYTNTFGLIIWRVFSADLTDFWIEIYEDNSGGAPRLVSRWGSPLHPRYNLVAESITVTSIFTTLRYYPGNPDIFRSRLLRYSRTVRREHGGKLTFRYLSIGRTDARFVVTPVAEYVVDVAASSIEERALKPGFSVRAPHTASPIHEGVRPGSYLPVG